MTEMIGTILQSKPMCPCVGLGRLQACYHTGHHAWVHMSEKDTSKPLPPLPKC